MSVRTALGEYKCSKLWDQSLKHKHVLWPSGNGGWPQHSHKMLWGSTWGHSSHMRGTTNKLCDQFSNTTTVSWFLNYFGTAFIYRNRRKDFLLTFLHFSLENTEQPNRTLSVQRKLTAALYYLNTCFFPTNTALALYNTANFRALKFLPRIILPIMMNWESGVNDASSVTALLLL